MKVLVACEFSGIVRDAFTAQGHEAWSCDLLPSETPGNHIQDDIRHVLDGRPVKFRSGGKPGSRRFAAGYWDLMIAHPPCTRLANSGVRWLDERNLWAALDDAARFFRLVLDADIPRIAVENPIPHKHAITRIGRTYDQVIQPWQFGQGETKAVCLWLKNLPLLEPTKIVKGRQARVHLMSPGPERAKERSRFFPGIARAFAQQWGKLN